jgi:hypothetical protein
MNPPTERNDICTFFYLSPPQISADKTVRTQNQPPLTQLLV